jgi:hypothetical protein
MKIKIAASCLLFVSIFLSCKKEDLSKGLNPGNTDVALLNEVLIDNQCTSSYLYTDSKLISEEKSKFDYTRYTYNNNGQLIKSEFYGNDDVLSTDDQVFESAINGTEWVTPLTGKLGGTITYSYNDNGQLIKTTYTRTSDPTSEYSEFTYDLKNRIGRQTMYWDNSPKGYIDYTYDSKGNLTREMLYNLPETGVAELSTTTSYTYDNQQNPYRTFYGLMMPGINTNKNNIMKETYTIHITPDQGSDNVLVSENTYEYNASGYPVSKNGNIMYVYD